MSPLDLYRGRKFSIDNEQWKVNTSIVEIFFLSGIYFRESVKSGFLKMLLTGRGQGGSITKIWQSYFHVLFQVIRYFIMPPCNDPVRLFLLRGGGSGNGYELWAQCTTRVVLFVAMCGGLVL